MLSYEHKSHNSPDTKATAARDHGKNYMKVRPLLVRHFWRDRLLQHTTTPLSLNKSQSTEMIKVYELDPLAFF